MKYDKPNPEANSEKTKSELLYLKEKKKLYGKNALEKPEILRSPRRDEGDLYYEGNFTIGVPEELIFASNKLSHAEIRLWITIRRHCKRKNEEEYERCWPGRERLAMMMGISETQVSIHISRLKGKGLLDVRYKGLGRTNDYFLKDPPKMWYRETISKIKKAKERKEKNKKLRHLTGKLLRKP